MTTRRQIEELKRIADPAVLSAAADEYADLLITMCLCMKLAGPTRENITSCAGAIKERLITAHSQRVLREILRAPDPVGCFLGLRREANEAAANYGEPADHFI